MVFYYEQNQPMYFALLVFSRTVTIFGLVARRLEFWLFFAIHVSGVILFRLKVLGVGEFEKFRWEAVSATQLFMVFCLTFFNGHCFTRYLKLYHLCMDVLDGVLFFVQELVVSMASPKVENYRVRAVKYVVAMLHIFFMGISGGMKTKHDWREIVRRGLLNKVEAEQLQAYPVRSIETVLVLSTWAMQIVDKALEHDVFWDFRSMRIAHTHNRLQNHMNTILASIHMIGDVLALPIPYPYYHVMNVVLIFNLTMLAVITASFSTYQTVFPFVVALMFFLGLREVAASLADPFNGEDSDFPVATFLQFAFDTSICLLEAFRNGDAEDFVSRLLDTCKEFTNEELRHVVPPSVLYQKNYDPTVSSPFSWHKEMPLASMAGTSQGPLKYMHANQMVLHPKHPHLQKRKNVDEEVNTEGEGKDEDTQPKIQFEHHHHHHHPQKKSRCSRCLDMCLKRRRAKFNVPDENSLAPEVLKAQSALDNAMRDHENLRKATDKWRKRVRIQQHMLKSRIEVGKAMGLPIDELIGTKNLEEENRQVTKKEADFTNFAQARHIIAGALKGEDPTDEDLVQEARDRFAQVPRYSSEASRFASERNLTRASTALSRMQSRDTLQRGSSSSSQEVKRGPSLALTDALSRQQTRRTTGAFSQI